MDNTDRHPGLDHLLVGALTANRVYLIEEDPKCGKTNPGTAVPPRRRPAERGGPLCHTLGREELIAVAESHGWDTSRIGICELTAMEDNLRPEAQYTMFHSWEVELSDTTRSVLQQVEELKPRRVVFDSLS